MSLTHSRPLANTYSPPISRSQTGRRTCLVCSAGVQKGTGQPSAFNNLLGVHANVWCGVWTREDAVRAIEGTKRAGFDLIEVPVFEPETLYTADTRAILEANGMQASTSLGLTLAQDLSSEDNDVVAEGKALLSRALKATHHIGGRWLVGVTYCALNKYPVPCSGLSRKNAVHAVRELAGEASDLGLTFGLEVINRYETNILNTAAQAAELVDEIGSENVKVHLDTYHMNIEEDSMRDAVLACGDRLGYVHVGESHRGYLGTGSVDWQSFFCALAASGYSGPLTFESFSSSVVSPNLSNLLCVWRDLWEDSEDLANHAREFMSANMRAATIVAQRNAPKK